MISLDWITLIIERKSESAHTEYGTMTSEPFKRKIEQCLCLFFTMNSWKPSLQEHSSATLHTRSSSYQLNLLGSFFIEPGYKEKIIILLSLLKDQGYRFHFTRIDVANTFKHEMKTLEKDIKKIKTKELKTVEYRKNKNLEYFACFNNRFSFVIYDKSLQIKKKMKKRIDYVSKFYSAYEMSPSDPICRIELRIKGADTCLVISYSDDIFKEIKAQYLLQIEKRIGITKNIKKIIINSPFNF